MTIYTGDELTVGPASLGAHLQEGEGGVWAVRAEVRLPVLAGPGNTLICASDQAPELRRQLLNMAETVSSGARRHTGSRADQKEIAARLNAIAAEIDQQAIDDARAEYRRTATVWPGHTIAPV